MWKVDVCKIKGHDDKLNDSGFPMCSRCGCHSYYDAEEYSGVDYFYLPIRWYKKISVWVWHKRQDFKYWLDEKLGRKTDIPF